MKKIYMISRIILTAITFILFSLLIIGGGSSFAVVPITYSIIVFACSFPSTKLAEKIIDKGQMIDNIFVRIGYYIILFIVLLIVCYICIYLINYIYNNCFITPTNLNASIRQDLFLLLIISIVCNLVILPYFQAIIINILKFIMHEY